MNNFMWFVFFIFLCDVVGGVLSADTSYYKPGLRIKYGAANDTAGRGQDFFFEIALTASEAEFRDGWVQVTLPDDTRYASRLTLRCPANDFTFCAFYDEYEYIAGLQVSIPLNAISSPVPVDQRIIGAILWSAPPAEGGIAQDYWTYQLFIVNGESLKKTKEEREALRAAKNTLLYNDALWISDTDHYSNTKLRTLSDTESVMIEDDYFRQRCISAMGRHYYYDFVSRRSCEETDPWFPLTSSGSNQLHGIGLTVQAVIPDPASGLRKWFEYPNLPGVAYTSPDLPQCEMDLIVIDNLKTIHMYFISEPWNIKCTDETDFQILGLET